LSTITVNESTFDAAISVSRTYGKPLGTSVQAALLALSMMPEPDRRRLVEYCDAHTRITDEDVRKILESIQ